MKIKTNKDSISIKVLKGGRLAIKNLIAERKKNDDYIIISRNGKPVRVKARSIK